MKAIILGPPGTGKGTQAKMLAGRLNLKHISSGELIRDEIKKGTKSGKLFESIISKGELLPDAMINNFLLIKIKGDYILDGYPRTVEQAKFLEKKGESIDFVIYLDSTKRVIIERLMKRAKIENRKDDTPEVIEKRFEIYNKETRPLLNYYKNKLIIVNGDLTIKEVFDEIMGKLNDRGFKVKP